MANGIVTPLTPATSPIAPKMVSLTTPNGSYVCINANNLEFIAPSNPSAIAGSESVIGFNGNSIPVQETVDQILKLINQ